MSDEVDLSPIRSRLDIVPVQLKRITGDRLRVVATISGRKTYQLVDDLLEKPLRELETELGLTEVIAKLRSRAQ